MLVMTCCLSFDGDAGHKVCAFFTVCSRSAFCEHAVSVRVSPIVNKAQIVFIFFRILVFMVVVIKVSQVFNLLSVNE